MAETRIKITADTQQAERDIRKLESALAGIDEVANGAGKALAAITAAAGAMGYAILKTLDSAGQLIDASKVLGMSAGNLQALQHAAAQAGVSTDELNSSLMRMSANIGDAIIKGTGPAKDAFDRLGISLDQVARQRPDQQFQTLAKALSNVQNNAERAALATDLFGKGMAGKALEVAKGFEEADAKLQKLGLRLNDMDVAGLDMAGDAVDELTSLFDSALKKAVADIAPIILGIVKTIKDAVEEAGGFEVVWNNIKAAIKTALNIAIFTAAILALGKMVTIVGGLYVAIRTAGTAMAAFNAIVMRNPLMLAVGAALLLAKVLGYDVVGYIAEASGLSANMAEATADIKVESEKIAEVNAKEVEYKKQLNQEQQKALKALDDTLLKLEQSAQFERDKLDLGEAQANINKAIAEEQAKLEKVGLSLNDQQKARITNAYTELQSIKDLAAINKAIRDLEVERIGLAIADKNEREVVVGIAKMEEQLKRSMTEQEKERLSTAIQLTQQAREQGAIAEAIFNYTRKQTELEKINRGIGLQGKLDPRGTAQADYTKDEEALQALRDRQLITEQEYYSQRTKLAEDFQLKMMELQNTEFQNFGLLNDMKIQLEAQRHADSLRNQTDFMGNQMFSNETIKKIAADRAAFEKKTDLEKTQFAIENIGSTFAALGAQNKKAFEASKALSIASAIMNTYQGATKALATYPFPFNLIAAAASIAAGMAQVSAIRSQQYSGRALGGPVMGGKTYMVGESGPELFTAQGTGSITRNGDLTGGGGTTNVTFQIQANDTAGFDQLLTQRKGLITQIIRDAQQERGQRVGY
jgi:hypothetical protein